MCAVPAAGNRPQRFEAALGARCPRLDLDAYGQIRAFLDVKWLGIRTKLLLKSTDISVD